MNIYKLNDELNIVARWFRNISKMADDKKNANGFEMSDEDVLVHIKNEARWCAEYVEKYLLIEKSDV